MNEWVWKRSEWTGIYYSQQKQGNWLTSDTQCESTTAWIEV